MANSIKTVNAIALNFHLLAPCNMRCVGCFSHLKPYLHRVSSFQQANDVLSHLDRLTREYPIRKLTFSGGEPTLLQFLPNLISSAKKLGFTTSVVSNGSNVTSDWLKIVRHDLDWLALSVDSLDVNTNSILGRSVSGRPISEDSYIEKSLLIKEHGIFLKINTVVSALNIEEDFSNFLSIVSPDRWKVMQALILGGENDDFKNSIVDIERFFEFVVRHKFFEPVAETSDSMVGSYAMIGPMGDIFTNSQRVVSYGNNISNMSVADFKEWYSRIRPRLVLRGGEYTWTRQSVDLMNGIGLNFLSLNK